MASVPSAIGRGKVLSAAIVPGLALLLLGAHFLRSTTWPAVAVCALAIGLLALRRPWAWRTVQAVLVLGTVEWAWTAFALVQQRLALGQPWGRLLLILGAVALLTAAAAWGLGRAHRTSSDGHR